MYPLSLFLYQEAAGLAHREKWPVCHGQQTVRGLSELAVVEMAEPTLYGSEPARVAFFGDHINLNGEAVWRAWEKGGWRGRYQGVYEILERYTEVAASHVYHKQREDEP
jgi:hypothetical protein